MKAKFFLMCMIALAVLFSGCLSEDYVNYRIEKANYCSVKDDCASIVGLCPFDCHVVVNKEEKEEILELMIDYKRYMRKECVYSCAAPGPVYCENSKCVMELPEVQGKNNAIIEEEPLAIVLSVSTDRKVYSSREDIQIIVKAAASKQANATVKVWGIMPSRRKYIEAEKTLKLKQGYNLIEFSETSPSCTSGCGGVNPGLYAITATVEEDEELIATAETMIELVKG